MELPDPIHQFEIKEIISLNLGSTNISFTNSALFMVLAVLIGCGFLLLASSRRKLVPGRWQSSAEMTYEFVANTLRSSAGSEGMRFFPLVFSLFLFILMVNLFGMVPYFFTVTSHLIVTAALSILVVGLVIVYGLYRNGLGFFRLFVPHGVPGVILPFVVFIEVLSFVSRPISLSIRLFANILAGHITLKVFAGFIVVGSSLGWYGWIAAVLPLILTVALTALEVLVAVLQAYVFAILTSLYLNDAIHPGH